jgi:uncharacterized protein
MIGLLELAGYGIVGGTLLHATVALFDAVQRRAATLRLERQEARLFERRAKLLLDVAEAARDKTELSWTGLRKFTIAQKVMEAQDICSFYLRPHDQKALPPFEPGQYLTFQLRIPGQPKAVIRCYSLSDSPLNRDYYRVTIKRLPPPRDAPEAPPGLSSNFFHESLRIGDTVDVRAPSGHFYLDRTHQKPVVLIGGGVGLTPVLSMLNTICESGDERETWFFYGVRNGGEHAMREHLTAIAHEHPNVRLIVCYSNPTEQDRDGVDYQRMGRVSVELMREILPSNNYEFYICGPPPMMESLVGGLGEWGVPEASVHVEAFGPASVKKKVPPAEAREAAESAGVHAVPVQFARSGKQVSWTADAGALLDLAEANGVTIDFACRAGNCGTCLTAIKEGDVTYLNEPGASPEAGSCLACIAVPKGPLVLDA